MEGKELRDVPYLVPWRMTVLRVGPCYALGRGSAKYRRDARGRLASKSRRLGTQKLYFAPAGADNAGVENRAIHEEEDGSGF